MAAHRHALDAARAVPRGGFLAAGGGEGEDVE